MCNAMLIIIRETVWCMSQQQWGVCQITWPSCCALCTVFAYLSNTTGEYSLLICKTTPLFTSRTFKKTSFFTVKLIDIIPNSLKHSLH